MKELQLACLNQQLTLRLSPGEKGTEISRFTDRGN